MLWWELTASEFASAVETVGGVCVVPVGVVEKHGPHLPLGTDVFWGQALAARAAQLEPALVFPPYYFGQIHEARHQPGTVALPRRLLLDVLEATCEEIARNGLRKIVLLNAHGGNEAMLQYFAQCVLERPRDWGVYVIRLGDKTPIATDGWTAMRGTELDYHAGELETSRILAVRPDLVKLDRAGEESGAPQKRLAHLPPVYTGIGWYADFPNHYAGDGAPGTPAKGRYALEHEAARVAAILAAIKTDTATPELLEEFYRASENPNTEG